MLGKDGTRGGESAERTLCFNKYPPKVLSRLYEALFLHKTHPLLFYGKARFRSSISLVAFSLLRTRPPRYSGIWNPDGRINRNVFGEESLVKTPRPILRTLSNHSANSPWNIAPKKTTFHVRSHLDEWLRSVRPFHWAGIKRWSAGRNHSSIMNELWALFAFSAEWKDDFDWRLNAGHFSSH